MQADLRVGRGVMKINRPLSRERANAAKKWAVWAYRL